MLSQGLLIQLEDTSWLHNSDKWITVMGAWRGETASLGDNSHDCSHVQTPTRHHIVPILLVPPRYVSITCAMLWIRRIPEFITLGPPILGQAEKGVWYHSSNFWSVLQRTTIGFFRVFTYRRWVISRTQTVSVARNAHFATAKWFSEISDGFLTTPDPEWLNHTRYPHKLSTPDIDNLERI